MASQDILSFLVSGDWISGEEMASHQGISRAAVWKQIKNLKSRGYEIEASTKKGYRLAKKPDLLDADLIQSGLKTKWLGRDLICRRIVSSTNEAAKSIARDCQRGTIIISEIQTEGRGRLSRSWASPPGGIWMSLVLKPKIPLAQVFRLNMATSVAISRSIQTLYGLNVDIKWPNDLLIHERKICGILMEVSAEVDRLEYAVVGLGINANVDVSGFPAEWNSTSLWQELGREVSRTELIQMILQEMEEAFETTASQEIYDEWRRRSTTLGKLVRITSVDSDLTGEALDLGQDGALLLKTEEGLKRILAGDCIHLRPLEEA